MARQLVETAVPQEFPSEIGLWLLAGQSNMEGYGQFDGQRQAQEEKVWAFSSAGVWELAIDPLHRLWESFTPVNQRLLRASLPLDHSYQAMTDVEVSKSERRDRAVGVGLGLPFAAALVQKTRRAVGLIPAAHGGTCLDDWWPDSSREERDSLHSAILVRAQRASAVSGSSLDGLLWYQGESDATPERSLHYEDRLVEWIQRVRTDLGRPDLPVLIVQLGRVVLIPALVEAGLDPQSWTRVREAQLAAAKRLSDVYVTGALDLELSDEIHLDAAALERLGHRLALLAAVNPIQRSTRSRSGPCFLTAARAPSRRSPTSSKVGQQPPGLWASPSLTSKAIRQLGARSSACSRSMIEEPSGSCSTT